MKKQTFLSTWFSWTWYKSKQVASMCQIAQLQVAKSLLSCTHHQVPVPTVPSLHWPGYKNKDWTLFSKQYRILKPPTLFLLSPLPTTAFTPLPTDMFWAFWVFEFYLLHKYNPKRNMSVYSTCYPSSCCNCDGPHGHIGQQVIMKVVTIKLSKLIRWMLQVP